MTQRDVFWIDREYDRESSPLGPSRYEAYAGRESREFDDAWGDISPVGFACTAWRLATPPNLDPGYVRYHRRVLTADCLRNGWDGSLTARVMLAAPWPEPLSRSHTWGHDRGWHDWPQVFGQFVQPSDQDVSKSPHARAVLLLDVPVPLNLLPAIPDEPPANVPGLASATVAVLVKELNDLLGPVVRRLEE